MFAIMYVISRVTGLPKSVTNYLELFLKRWYGFSLMLHNLQQVLFLFLVIADARDKVL